MNIPMTWRIVAIVLLLIVGGTILYSETAEAYQPYVICQSMDGTQAMFPGYTCPPGWIFVRVVN